MRWRLGALIALMLGIVLAACGSTSGSTKPITPSTTTTIPAIAEGTVGAYLDVPTSSVVAGGELAATVVVVNRTGAPISIASCGPYFYGAGFESDTVTRTDLSFLTCLGPPVSIPVGESRWPVTATALYSGCGGTGLRPSPACVDGRPPSLPTGDYRLVVGSIDPRAPIPTKVDVSVR
jgi:hypothetical protein